MESWAFCAKTVSPTMWHICSLLHAAVRRKIDRNLIEAKGEARTDLQWWAEKLKDKTELSLITKSVTASITTDTSDARDRIHHQHGENRQHGEGKIGVFGKEHNIERTRRTHKQGKK